MLSVIIIVALAVVAVGFSAMLAIVLGRAAAMADRDMVEATSDPPLPPQRSRRSVELDRVGLGPLDDRS
ncbi:MAG TPA: hypothetical protein VKG62_06075 [Solirubrobacteraceae bacterium]|nr:hypothetical protein [Solirubrobacteraceae bacterium]